MWRLGVGGLANPPAHEPCLNPPLEAIMPLFRPTRGRAKAGVVCAALLSGCALPPGGAKLASRPESAPPIAETRLDVALAHKRTIDGQVGDPSRDVRAGAGTSPRNKSPEISTVDYEEMADDLAPAVGSGEELFAGQIELGLAELVSEVQRRNQSLQAVLAAWGAPSERYPQVGALDGPTFTTQCHPAAF